MVAGARHGEDVLGFVIARYGSGLPTGCTLSQGEAKGQAQG